MIYSAWNLRSESVTLRAESIKETYLMSFTCETRG